MNVSRQPSIDHCSLSCGDGHRLHIGLAGATEGIPLVVFHGGPGSGCNAPMLAPVDLTRFRVIMIDQRGSGRSRPSGRVQRNMTSWLIRDIETIRRYLEIPSWYVLGGSWGATLAIAYAGMHPTAVNGLVLRGTFLASGREVRGLLSASRQRAPQAWLDLYRASGADRPAVLLSAIHKRLNSERPSDATLSQAYDALERAVLSRADRTLGRRIRRPDERRSKQLYAKYRIQTHYLLHACGLRRFRLSDLAARVSRSGIDVIAIHGRRDPVCPPGNLAWLRHYIPGIQTELIDAGHLPSGKTMTKALSNALLEISRGYGDVMPYP